MLATSERGRCEMLRKRQYLNIYRAKSVSDFHLFNPNDREITSFMISLDPPQTRCTRASKYACAIGYSIVKP